VIQVMKKKKWKYHQTETAYTQGLHSEWSNEQLLHDLSDCCVEIFVTMKCHTATWGKIVFGMYK
jgi:hypothetical protein